MSLQIEKWTAFTIGDDRLRSHLAAFDSKMRQWTLNEVLNRFGIHEIGDLTAEQIHCLIGARNLRTLTHLLQIPANTVPETPSEDDIHTPHTSLSPTIKEFLDSTPSESQEFDPLLEPEDIPLAVPEDLLLRRIAPREFLRRLTEGELLRSAWLQQDRDEFLEIELEGVTDPEDQSESLAVPFSVLLLDASESMATRRDRRNLVARALGVAFLWEQHEAHHPVWVYFYRKDLSEGIGGEDRSGFQAAVAAVLKHQQFGMTHLQRTLGELAERMQQDAERVDIALITDGFSRLSENPLGDAHLHSFLLGDDDLELDKANLEQFKNSIEKLQGWSDHYFALRSSSLADCLTPTKRDILSLNSAISAVAYDLEHSATHERLRQILQRVKNAEYLLTQYLEHNALDDEIRDFKSKLELALAESGKLGFHERVTSNTQGWTQADVDTAIALERREVASMMDFEHIDLAPPATKSAFQVNLTQWETLLLLLRALLRKFNVAKSSGRRRPRP